MITRCCFKRGKAKKVAIIGGGFAGVQAAIALSCCRRLEVALIDKGAFFNFLPLLPDTIGRGLSVRHLAYPLVNLCKRYGICYAEADVQHLDLEKRKIFCSGTDFDYEYLIIASGSQTNFYGNESLSRVAFKLDDVSDAAAIRKSLAARRPETFIVAGGGYTGIEVATNLRLLTQRQAASGQGAFRRIVVVERAPSILGPLPSWMKDFVKANLERMRIEIRTDATIRDAQGETVDLSGGEHFERAMLFWAGGVQTAGFIQSLAEEKNPQGRIKVDGFLRLRDNVFVAGDAALVSYRGAPLRMAVQFALTQGAHAARNLMHIEMGERLKPYRPVDQGYIIPMANNNSCGAVFGRAVRGRLATTLHYIMCIYRSYGLRNKLGVLNRLTRRSL
ncbi:MAG TPA: FAD-dependent oxidoreductase [Candidatus Omnitrophota bacterium]|nr:FAD-dependent oxidoreductase [Candidatus Omnitrophota bacterium]HRZ14381.1 FAD-dependent oxidoreductase [Candidatus Omnitrophota bacterium]